MNEAKKSQTALLKEGKTIIYKWRNGKSIYGIRIEHRK
jgi:hypothetical protein